MLCTGCGKEIPFAGQVCPYCQRDKTADQGRHLLLMVCLLIGAGVGYLIGGFSGLLWGAGAGMVLGVIAALAVTGATQPPQVRLADHDAREATPPPTDTAKQRLEALETLRKDGLITDAEFAEKRQQILDKL